MRVLDLFAGVGGFSLGAKRAGCTLVGSVEIDNACQSVLRRAHPGVPVWGDITKVHGGDLPHADLATWGSPCQDLSSAGKRAGLSGERSGLFYEGLRVIKEMRRATADVVGGPFPRWTVWENVAGALSSSRGDDFRAVLREHADLGPHLIEWRVLDAQHVGGCTMHPGPKPVPQRRARVFVVACFDPRSSTAGPVLAEPEGPGGDSRADDTQRAATAARAVASVAVKAARARNATDHESWVVQQGAPAPTLNVFDNATETRATVLVLTPHGPRRLTPLECERLMGWPDNWTATGIRPDGTTATPISDLARYRMTGNGVAANVAEWVVRRIQAAEEAW